MLIPKRKAIIMCMLVRMISLRQFFFFNKISYPSCHNLSLFLCFVILVCDVFIM